MPLDNAPVPFCGVPAPRIPYVWDQFEPFIASAVARGVEKYRSSDILEELLARNMQLWAGLRDGKVRAVCVTEVINYPLAKVCRILIATGSDPAHMNRFMPELETWAKAQGCSAISANARPGWEKFLGPDGYRKTHVLLEKKI